MNDFRQFPVPSKMLEDETTLQVTISLM